MSLLKKVLSICDDASFRRQAACMSNSGAFNQLMGGITDGRKTRPDIFHPVYCVGILFTASLFARVSDGIVISGRLVRSAEGGISERGVWFEENISISVGKRAGERRRKMVEINDQ